MEEQELHLGPGSQLRPPFRFLELARAGELSRMRAEVRARRSVVGLRKA